MSFLNQKPPLKQAAFTLIELLLVILIITVLSLVVAPKFLSRGGFSERSVVEQLIAFGRTAQSFSMNDSARLFALSISSNQLQITADGSLLALAGLENPVVFSDVILSPSISIGFNGFGQPAAAQVISIQGETNQQVCFETSGLIHLC